MPSSRQSNFAATTHNRVAQALVVVSVFFAAAVMLHGFFNFTGHAPYLAADESLANVSVTLASEGRYGFLASPIQSRTTFLRTDSFFNYGPWYFLAGAGFSWLFGNALEIFRSIHPFGLIAAVGLAFFAFRHFSYAAWGLFAAGILTVFTKGQWPMIRPDIMVTVFAAAAIMLAGRAMRSGAWPWWLGMGFCAGSAVVSHPVAWALIPATGAVWGWWVLTTIPKEEVWKHLIHVAWPSLLPLVAGGLLAGGVFLIAIDFRIGDFFGFINAYTDDRPASNLGYINILKQHLLAAWGGLLGYNIFSILLAFGLLAAIGLLIFSIRMSSERRLLIATVIAPPAILWIVYQLSLGFFPNFHTGYVIFSQTGALWTASSGLAVLGRLAIDKVQRSASVVEASLSVFVAVLVLSQAVNLLSLPSSWRYAVDRSVNIKAYVRHVLAPLPERARAWGSTIFEPETGNRVDLVLLQDGNKLADTLPPEHRRRGAPDFLVLAYPDLMHLSANLLAAFSGHAIGPGLIAPTLGEITRLFPDRRYRQINLVHAPPYGMTRVYQALTEPEAGIGEMRIAVNDGLGPQWRYRLGPPMEVSTLTAAALTLNIEYFTTRISAQAAATRSIVLPAGIYRMVLRREGTGGGAEGVFVTAPADKVSTKAGGLSLGVTAIPYFAYEKDVSIILAHDGGPVFVGQFETNNKASFVIHEVSPVIALTGQAGATQDGDGVTLPLLATWETVGKVGVKTTPVDGGGLKVAGSDSRWGHQVESPYFEVEKETVLELVLPTRVTRGRIAIGIIDKARTWVLPPTDPNRRIVFATGPADKIKIVIANDNSADFNKATAFSIQPGALKILERKRGGQYVDLLTRCYVERRDGDMSSCAKKNSR